MSGLLEYLVDRVLLPDAAPRPRARARFEPPGDAAPALAEDIAERPASAARPERGPSAPRDVVERPEAPAPLLGDPERRVARAEADATSRAAARRAAPAADEPVAIEPVARHRARPAREPAPAAAAAPRPPIARAESIRARAAAALEADGAPAAAPVVRVTIGRVEVRAVTGAPPAMAERPAPRRRASLDEYLNARSRGARP